MLIRRFWWQVSLLILILITILSLSPLNELPSVTGSDKTHHFIAYTSLMIPVALRRPRNWFWLGASFILYSGCIELVQPYVNRHGEWLDLFANASGVIFGALVGRILSRLGCLCKKC